MRIRMIMLCMNVAAIISLALLMLLTMNLSSLAAYPIKHTYLLLLELSWRHKTGDDLQAIQN